MPLRVAGLMSDAPYEEVAALSRGVSKALQEADCPIKDWSESRTADLKLSRYLWNNAESPLSSCGG